MSKYKMLCDVRGADGEIKHEAGDTVELGSREAARFVKRRVAEKIEPEPEEVGDSEEGED